MKDKIYIKIEAWVTSDEGYDDMSEALLDFIDDMDSYEWNLLECYRLNAKGEE